MAAYKRIAARRGLAVTLAVVLLASGGVASASSQAPRGGMQRPATQSVDTAGIPLVAGVAQPHPKSESEAAALSDAQVFAENHSDAVGYPWLDPDTKSLQLSAASEVGQDLLADESVVLGSELKTMSIAVRSVKVSLGQLAAISDDITTLVDKGIRDADLIYSTAPDYQGNRIVIRVSAASAQLFSELASRYGTDAIAVWIDPKGAGGAAASRLTDVSPYWGGAKIGAPKGGCSDSFSWLIGGTTGNALLTAAHCIPDGGNVSIGASTTVRGHVTASTEENWSTTLGTRYYSGQSVYRGDVALIRLNSGLRSDPSIYRGAPTSSSHSLVVSVLRRYSYPDENVFVGGMVGGETGVYHISQIGANWWYTSDGPNVWVRNVVLAYLLFPSDPLAQHGDSGGSVFRENGSGDIIAVGTFSGLQGQGGIVFTDIYNTYLALPGDINLP